MRVIGLTGGIACGKSNVSSWLREQGVPVIDGDELAHELTAPGGAALPEIRKAFGDSLFREDGTLDRKALGNVVFSDSSALRQLDEIVQPAIRSMILDQIGKLREKNAMLCVLDMPLLFEKDLDRLCDRVWCVYLPECEQIKRLINRDHITAQQASARIGSQMPVQEKVRRSDCIIDTSGTIEETRMQLPALLEEELRAAERSGL